MELLPKGSLLKAPDVYEPLAYLEQRIAELTERRDRLQLSLDGHLRTAEQLLAAAAARQTGGFLRAVGVRPERFEP